MPAALRKITAGERWPGSLNYGEPWDAGCARCWHAAWPT